MSTYRSRVDLERGPSGVGHHRTWDRLFMRVGRSIGIALILMLCCTPNAWAKERPLLEMPSTVFAYGGVENPSKFFADVRAMGTAVDPNVPDLNMLAQVGIQGLLSLSSTSVLDFNKPIRFAVLNSPNTSEPWALVLGVSDRVQFEAALPSAGRLAKDQGNAWSIPVSLGSQDRFYLNFLQNAVVLTQSPKLFAQHESFLSRLAKHSGGDGFEANLSVESLMGTYRKEVNEAIDELIQELRAEAARNPAQASELSVAVNMIKAMGTLGNELKSLHVDMQADGKGMNARMSLVAKLGSDLATFFTGLKGTPHTLWVEEPEAASMVMSLSMDEKASSQAFMNGYLKLLFDGLKGAQADKELTNLRSALDLWFQSVGREIVISAFQGEDGNLALSGRLDTLDGDKQLEAFHQMTTAIQQETLKATLETPGLKTEYQRDAYTVQGRPVYVMKNTITDPSLMPFVPKGLMEMHMLFGKKKVFFTYGEASPKRLKQSMGATSKALQRREGVQYAFAQSPNNAFIRVYLSPIALLRDLNLNGSQPFAAAFASLKPEYGLGLWAEGHPNRLNMGMNVPVKLVKDIVAAVGAVQRTQIEMPQPAK